MDRWDERSKADPALADKYTEPPIMKASSTYPTKGPIIKFSLDQPQNELQPQCRPLRQCYGPDSCVPGMVLLSDSEDASYASCGTEEFFDFEDISNALSLMENWHHKLNRRVRFRSANVREYALTVGDHPICRDGLALSLDWEHSDERVYNIDDYEQHRRGRNQRQGCKRRTSKLDYWQRREILQRVSSFTNQELSRIECERNKQAVFDFLAACGDDEGVRPLDSDGDQGVELLELEPDEDDLRFASFSHGMNLQSEWQMKVHVIED